MPRAAVGLVETTAVSCLGLHERVPSRILHRFQARPPPPRSPMSPDFIYTMKDLRKVVPPKREILKGIWLSFYDGAKIGVLGSERRGQELAAPHHGGRGPGLHRRGLPRQGLHGRASCRRSRSSIRRRTCSRTSRRASPRRWRSRRALERDQRALRRADGRRRDDRRCSTSRRRSRTRWTPATSGSSTASSRSRWTRCAARRPTRT